MSLSKNIEDLVEQLKDTFKIGGSSVIGLDIGLSAVKIAEIIKSGSSYKLLRYETHPLPEGVLVDNEIQKDEDVIAAINTILEQARFGTTNAAIAMFGTNVLVKKLQLAGGTMEEIDNQVSWEIEQYLTIPIDEAMISFHYLGENEGGGAEVVVAAAKRDLVTFYKDVVEKTKLKVKIVDTQVTAIVNVFEYVLEEKLDAQNVSWLLMDIGAQKTSFVIYRNNSIFFAKEIAFGGVMITEEIQRKMGVNYIDAENLKIVGDGNGNLPQEINEIISDVTETFFSELRKTMDFYLTSTSDDSLKECFLTGGSSLLPDLKTGLEPIVGVPVYIFDPFESIDVDKSIDEEDIKKIKSTGCVALGLAMRKR